MIVRDLVPQLFKAATQAPCVTLTGPRQSGKTTLCRASFPGHRYVTLEAPDQRQFAVEDPRAFLAQFPDGAILDEVQRAPDILSYLQGAIDDDPRPGRWILSGSQNLALLASVSQSLAGRTEAHHLLPLTHGEVASFDRPPMSLGEALFTGGYPRIFDWDLEPADWLRSYVATYLERDVRAVGNVGDLALFQRFVELCAGRTGQLLNYSTLAGDCGISQPTAKAWLSVLEASFIVFRLPAFHANLRKRLVKMPKLYFYDTGLACWLLGIREFSQLFSHPLRGSIFETWVVSETLKHRTNRGLMGGLAFYRDRNGAEVDLVLDRTTSVALVEAKSAATPSSRYFDAPRLVRRYFAPSRKSCELAVVYGGDQYQERSEGCLIPWRQLRSVGLAGCCATIVVLADGRPVDGVEILVLFPNRAWQRALTGKQGEAVLNLHSVHAPMAVFVATEGFAGQLKSGWIPAERVLKVDLDRIPEGGSVILPDGIGAIPGLRGRLKAMRDEHGRHSIHTTNIAINGSREEPQSFVLGEEMRLADDDGGEKLVCILNVIGRSVLLEYRTPPEQPKSN